MKLHMRASHTGFALAVLTVAMAVAAYPVHAQALAQQPASGTGLNDLLANPGEWASTVFNAALVGLGQKATGDVVGFMGWLLGGGNVISQTPPGLSYDSDVVNRLWGLTRAVANSALAVVTVWGGFNVMTRATDTFRKASCDASIGGTATALVFAPAAPRRADHVTSQRGSTD